jgi:hypothetical protein
MTISFRCDKERLQRFKGEEGKGRCPSTGTRLCVGTPSFEMVIPRGSESSEGTLEAYTAKTVYRKFETNTVFPEMKLPGLSHKSYIHVNVCDLYIPTIGLQENRWTVGGNI